MKTFPRWYQIRDDYQNLQNKQYAAQNGFCEDVNKGKLLYSVVLCCELDPVARAPILEAFGAKERIENSSLLC